MTTPPDAAGQPRADRGTFWGWVRTHPVAVFGGAAAVLVACESQIAAQHLLSGTALGWLGVATTAAVTLGAVATHQATTPVADPRADDGEPLVPAVRPGDAP